MIPKSDYDWSTSSAASIKRCTGNNVIEKRGNTWRGEGGHRAPANVVVQAKYTGDGSGGGYDSLVKGAAHVVPTYWSNWSFIRQSNA